VNYNPNSKPIEKLPKAPITSHFEFLPDMLCENFNFLRHTVWLVYCSVSQDKEFYIHIKLFQLFCVKISAFQFLRFGLCNDQSVSESGQRILYIWMSDSKKKNIQ